jgi:lysocardiolipin and lysophospholipid acyltransferase
MSSIPLDDAKEFDAWLRDRWVEKDNLLEHYVQNGRFPADDGVDTTAANGPTAKTLKGAGHIETQVQLENALEFLQIFAPLAALAVLVRLIIKLIHFTGALFKAGK